MDKLVHEKVDFLEKLRQYFHRLVKDHQNELLISKEA